MEEFKIDPKEFQTFKNNWSNMSVEDKTDFIAKVKEATKNLPPEEVSQMAKKGEIISKYMKAQDFIDNDMKIYMQEKLDKNRRTAYKGGILSDDRVMYKDGGAGIEALRKEAPEVVERMGYEEGGSMDDQMLMVMTPPMESEMESDDDMEDNYTKFIMEEALSEEEEDMLTSKLEQDEELSMLFDKIIDVAQEFAGSGPVNGPGSGVSDSIPARLSDGEFVFTAKAVEEIGEDSLMSMMKDAEAKADERQGLAEGGMPEEEDRVVVEPMGEPTQQNIRVAKETVDTPTAMVRDEEDLLGDGVKMSMLRQSRNLG